MTFFSPFPSHRISPVSTRPRQRNDCTSRLAPLRGQVASQNGVLSGGVCLTPSISNQIAEDHDRDGMAPLVETVDDETDFDNVKIEDAQAHEEEEDLASLNGGGR